MITFYIHRTVRGWEYPWLRTAFHWFPRDKKDRKDSRNSARLNTCNLPPSELTSHTLLWRVMEWTNSGIMSGSIESNLRRNAHSHAQMPCGGIMGSIMRWTVPRGRFQKTPEFPGIAADQEQRCGDWRGWVPVCRVWADRLYYRTETEGTANGGIDRECHQGMRNKSDRPWWRYRPRPWAVLRLCYCVIQME